MLTLNPRQLRSLAAVAPGTLLLTNDSMTQTTFITTEEDRERTGIWAIMVNQSGDVGLRIVGDLEVHSRKYDDVMLDQIESELSR